MESSKNMDAKYGNEHIDFSRKLSYLEHVVFSFYKRFTKTADIVKYDIDIGLKDLKDHKTFLEKVHNHGNHNLYKGKATASAIIRYVNYWLPMVAEYLKEDETLKTSFNLIPPLDIAWIWHCHRLAPLKYEKYCLTEFGKLLDEGTTSFLCTLKDDRQDHGNHQHTLIDDQQKHEDQQDQKDRNHDENHKKFKRDVASTKKYWNKMYKTEDFYNKKLDDHFKSTDEILESDIQSCSEVHKALNYDLILASDRQHSLLWQVSSKYYDEDEFLNSALFRYQRFLQLMAIFKFGRKYLYVPNLDIDLCWHTHQLKSTTKYLKDTIDIVGIKLNHDDTQNDRSKGGNQQNGWHQSQKLWKKAYYNNPFVLYHITKGSGGYRGEPNAKYYEIA